MSEPTGYEKKKEKLKLLRMGRLDPTLLQVLDADRFLIEELEKAWKTLEWYAAPMKPHEFYVVDAKDRGYISDLSDWGDRARKALEE